MYCNLSLQREDNTELKNTNTPDKYWWMNDIQVLPIRMQYDMHIHVQFCTKHHAINSITCAIFLRSN